MTGSVDKDVETGNPHIGGSKTFYNPLGEQFGLSTKAEHTYAVWLSNSTGTPTGVFSDSDDSFVCNSSDLETTQVSINRRMVK